MYTYSGASFQSLLELFENNSSSSYRTVEHDTLNANGISKDLFVLYLFSVRELHCLPSFIHLC